MLLRSVHGCDVQPSEGLAATAVPVCCWAALLLQVESRQADV
jgi:hypothetical protein